MRHWFQNLNENKKKKFHFRGTIRSTPKPLGRYDSRVWLHYEVCSGKSLKLKYTTGSDYGPQLTIGLFFVTFYLSSFLFKMPFFGYGRQYGFYFYEWALVWQWGTKVHESSSRTPWYRSFYFRIDDFFLGRSEVLSDEMLSTENVQFKVGEKIFTMNNITWLRKRAFRQYLPFILYNHKWISVEMKIDKPPMRAGKGENSWDCDDDGTYGLYSSWNGTQPNWDNKKLVTREAIEYYCAGAIKDAKKYGRGSGEHGISATDLVQIIEPVRKSNEAVEVNI